MESNPDLSFSEAIRLSSKDIKENIISIRRDIERQEIKRSIGESFSFQNIKSTVIFLFFSIATYGCFQVLGAWGAPITSSISGLTIIGLMVCALRMRNIPASASLQLQYRKQNFWLPLLLAASLAFIVSMIMLKIIVTGHFWSYINDILLIPVALSYGFLLKVMIHICTFWVDDIHMRAHLEKRIMEVA